MSWQPSDSAIKVTKTLEERIAASSSQAEVQQILREAAVAQGVVRPDIYDPNVLLEVAPGTAPRAFAKTVTVNGVKHTLEAPDEASLLAQENAIYREAMAQPAAAVEPPAQPRNVRGQFVSAEDIAAKVELELKFKRGEVSAADYLEQSGAVDDYLAKRGVNVEDLAEAAQDKAATRDERSWAAATESFLSGAGSSWPGGQQNMRILGQILVENNLVDSEDKVGALEAAYNHARENGMLVSNPEVEMRGRIAGAKSVEEIRDAIGYQHATGLFGR